MVEVGQSHNFYTETIFLAVNYLDRYLSVMAVCREKLQLVGTACVLIAA
jgi:cyclin A